MRSTLYILFTVLLSSCATVSYIGIETYNPAEITFPDNVRKILLVNNAVPQPPHTGYEYNLFGVVQDTCQAVADSALFDATKALGEAILENGYFEDVLLYNETTRTDTVFLADTKLTQQQVEQLCLENGVDAIVSIDRLLFNMKKSVFKLNIDYLTGAIDVDISGVVRSYIPARENALATVLVRDSIYWMESAHTLTNLDNLFPTPEEALRAAGTYMGAKIYPNFVPFWQNETRWVYNGMNTRWKEASAYAANSKWDKAAERWETIFQKTGSWKEKAKAASNLALAYEIQTDLEKAYDWAQKSYDLFNEKKGEEDKHTRLQKLYADALAQRIRLDQKLNIQFGEKSN